MKKPDLAKAAEMGQARMKASFSPPGVSQDRPVSPVGLHILHEVNNQQQYIYTYM
jgi:hypothetical protein